ncbi:hypothetical protein FALCPG4_002267 [Fusarium falciforme]
MDSATELTMWHIQCIHAPLQTTKAISRYIRNVNAFLDSLWEDAGEAAPIPPQLEVDAVENSVVTHRGASMDVVRLRFKLLPKHQGSNDEFLSAIRYFCEQIFKLKGEGELDCYISLMSPRSLIGIAPLSQWFRFYWTQGFLETFIRRRVPLFNEVADATFFGPWLGGVVYVVLLSDEKPSDILRGIKIALAKNFDFEAKRPPLEMESKRLSRDFLSGVERLLRHLETATEACTTAINEGATKLPSDPEIKLFNAVLGVFENGFETLTANKEVFEEWQNIVADAAGKLRTAFVNMGLSSGLLAIVAATARGGAAGAGAAGAGAAGAGAGAAVTAGAVIWPVAAALFIVSCTISWVYNKNHNKAKEEGDKLKKLSEGIQGHYDIARYLAQWLISGHKPAQADEGSEMQDMRAQLGERGLMPTLSLRDYKAGISSEADVIRQQLRKMREDPDLKDYFS